VLPELPAKQRTVVPLPCQPRLLQEYRKAEVDFEQWVRDTQAIGSSISSESKLQALLQLSLQAKQESLWAWVRDFLEGEGKLVLYFTHTAPIEAAYAAFPEYEPALVNGSVTGAARQREVDRFVRDPECRLFLANIQAAGEGLDGLQGSCSDAAFAELPWTPAEVDQAEDRIHRMGQRESVAIHYLLAAGTLEETLAGGLDHARQVVTQIVDGKKADSHSMLSYLLKAVLQGGKNGLNR
jgi:SWI/SNF-related matrix-associated actin-dependent regulator 1 of chromatin subfamily A